MNYYNEFDKKAAAWLRELIAARTLSDYTGDVVPLKVFFGGMLTEHIQPLHIQTYLDMGAEEGRPVRANREKACLSSCLSWLIRTGKTPALNLNPCMEASGTKRNPESKRERYVTNEEYLAIFEAAGTQVRLLMELTYRTLQRPESDILGWTPAILTRAPHSGKRVLTIRQDKTEARVKIVATEQLEALIVKAMGKVPRIDQPLLHTREGEGYTYDGISSMLRRYIGKANKARVAKGLPPFASFGFRDLKGKGATDVWLAGTPIEQIQLLCGHADKAPPKSTSRPGGMRPQSPTKLPSNSVSYPVLCLRASEGRLQAIGRIQ